MSGACNQRGVEVNSVRSAEQHAVLVTKPLHTEEFCFHAYSYDTYMLQTPRTLYEAKQGCGVVYCIFVYYFSYWGAC